MSGLSKSFSLLIILILAVSSLITAESVSAQTTSIKTMSNPVIIATPTPTPTPEPTPIVTPTSNIALNYSEASRASEGVDTRLVLAVSVQYNFGDAVTINYQDFVLNILTERGGLEPYPIMMLTGNAKPIETGSVTVNSTIKEANFPLTFRFPTMQYNQNGPAPFATYQLVYEGDTSTSPTPTPTTPEFSSLAIQLSLITMVAVAAISILLYRRHRK